MQTTLAPTSSQKERGDSHPILVASLRTLCTLATLNLHMQCSYQLLQGQVDLALHPSGLFAHSAHLQLWRCITQGGCVAVVRQLGDWQLAAHMNRGSACSSYPLLP